VLLEKVRALAPAEPRILDVGAWYEVERLRALPAQVDTLGFRTAVTGDAHVEFDLRNAERRDRWPELGPYDVVVCAEVLEHLEIAPLHVLGFLASALRPGGWLVLQTPNAVRISNRLRLMFGRSPFELPSGHFREYTLTELLTAAGEAWLEPGGWLTADYFDTGSLSNAVVRRLSPIVPPSLRAGITAWFQKADR
jgi:SAM-dependent methyltransferase